MSHPGRAQLVSLVARIRAVAGTEQEIDAWVEEFIASVPHPAASDLIFWPEHELSDEEIVDAALAYRPVQPAKP